MDKSLLSVMLSSRSGFAMLMEHITPTSYSPQFQKILKYVGEYYRRDQDATSVDRNTLLQLIAVSLRNEKHLSDFTYLIDEAIASPVSEPNIKQLILVAKREETGDQLAVALANRSPPEVIEPLLELYGRLHKATELDTLYSPTTPYRDVDIEALVATEFNADSFIKLYPLSLNDRLDGGVKGGHSVLVFGRPEAAKTLFAINAACGFARQGLRGFYFINEDRAEDIILRCVSNLSGMTKFQIKADPKEATRRAEANGFRNLVVTNACPGTPQQFEDLLDREEGEMSWVVVDQLRNIRVKSDSRTNQLEKAATDMRDLGKKHNVVMVNVTQAGESAAGKRILDMSDVDSSKTGIPSQADLMIGIGVDLELEQNGLRMLSLPKNKLSGDHGSFLVKVDTTLSRMGSR